MTAFRHCLASFGRAAEALEEGEGGLDLHDTTSHEAQACAGEQEALYVCVAASHTLLDGDPVEQPHHVLAAIGIE